MICTIDCATSENRFLPDRAPEREERGRDSVIQTMNFLEMVAAKRLTDTAFSRRANGGDRIADYQGWFENDGPDFRGSPLIPNVVCQ